MMEQTTHALRIIDDICTTLRASNEIRAVVYDEPTVEGLLAVRELPHVWVWDFQDRYDLADMNTLIDVTTQVGMAVLFPVARGESMRRRARWWVGTLQSLLLVDEGRTANAFLTEPIAAVIQPVAETLDRGAIFYQVAVHYWINRTDPWANQHQ